MKPKVFRSLGARVAGWAWMVLAAANLIDIAVRGRDLAALIAAAVLLTGCGLAYMLGLRPAIVADEAGVWLRNPLKDVRIPWPALQQIDVGGALRFRCVVDGEPWQAKAWVLQTSPRAQARARARESRRPDPAVPAALAEHLEGRTPADFAAEQLTELAVAHGGGKRAGKARRGETAARPSVSWSIPTIVAVAVPGAVLVALGLVGSLT